MKNFLKAITCWIKHGKFITKKGEGDYNIVNCSKCDLTWIEPR